MPSLGVITRDTVEGPRPHRLTPSFVTLPLAAFSPFRGSSGSAPRSSVGPSEASPPACVSDPPRSSGHSTSPIGLAWAVPLRCVLASHLSAVCSPRAASLACTVDVTAR